MTRRLALAAMGLSSGLILVLCLVGGRLAELGFAALAMAFPALLMVIGAAGRDGRLGPIAWPIAGLFLLLEICLLGMLAYRGQVENGPWLLGLPAAAAIQLYGVFLAPLALVALGYALTFSAFAVGDDDLERLRRLSERDRSE